MPTTVRVEDEVKRELDRLQGDILAERGERLSHNELLARLLRFARLHEDALMQEDGSVRRPTRDDLRRLMDRVPRVKATARARDVDDALYGGRP